MRFKARRGTAKRFLPPVLVIGVFAALVVGAQAAPGDLDPGYGEGGLSTVDILGNGNDDFATSMVMDEANRAVLAGYTEAADEDMAAARFKVDGTPDLSAYAGPGGTDSASLQIDLGGNDRANAIAGIGGDKKIVLAGQTDVNGDEDFAVVRRNVPGGSADTTFNAAGPVPGQLLIDVCGTGGNDVATSVIRLNDGKYMVGGYTDCMGDLDFAIARVTNKGVLDPKLTNANACPAPVCSPQPGVVLVDFGGDDQVTGLWAYSNTKWFASGYSDANGTNDFAFAGFQGVNKIIPGFGGQGTGRGLFDLGGDDKNLAVTIDNNKKIIVAGSSGGNMIVARFKPNAKGLDLSFAGGSGVEVGDFGGTDVANAVVYQRRLDRKILPAGSTDASGNNDFGVERLLKDGARDTQFHGGQVTTNFNGTSDDVATGIGFNTQNGKVIVGGYTDANGDYDFAVAGYLPT